MSKIQKCPYCQTVFATADGICPHCKKSVHQSEEPETAEKEAAPPKAETPVAAAEQPSLDDMMKAAEASAAQTAAKYTKPKKYRSEMTEDESTTFWIWWGIGALAVGVMWLLCMIFENNYYTDWQHAVLALAFVPMLIYGLVLFHRKRKGWGWKTVFFAELFLSLAPTLDSIPLESFFSTIYMIEGIIAVIAIWIAVKF